jgi:hypothetical protein
VKLRSLVFVLALAACGGSTPGPASAPGPVSSPDPAAGGGGSGSAATGCAREIAIRCATGVDGCDAGKTTEHVCVPLDATLGPSCELELALVCPAGQIDGCLRTPPAAARHICILQ